MARAHGVRCIEQNSFPKQDRSKITDGTHGELAFKHALIAQFCEERVISVLYRGEIFIVCMLGEVFRVFHRGGWGRELRILRHGCRELRICRKRGIRGKGQNRTRQCRGPGGVSKAEALCYERRWKRSLCISAASGKGWDDCSHPVLAPMEGRGP